MKESDSTTKRQSMTPKQVAEREGVTKHTVWNWCHRGVRGCQLKATLHGGRLLIDVNDLERFKAEIQGKFTAAFPPPVVPDISHEIDEILASFGLGDPASEKSA